MRFFTRKKDSFDYTLERTCLTCATTFQGKFCGRCGEKVVEPYERSIRYFLGNLVNALTFIDGKFFTSFKTLLTKPGKMSADIAIGIRQPYMKPVAFFFVGNFIYFLLPIFETFNSSLRGQMEFMPYSSHVKEVVEVHLSRANLSLDEFSKVYNASSTNWAKIILILLAPLTFPFFVLVNYARKNYLSDHFIFSLEFASFLVFGTTILIPLFLVSTVFLFKYFGVEMEYIFSDAYTVPVILLSVFTFLLVGIRKFYNFLWWRVVLNAFLLTMSMWMVIHAYRFILFQVTILSV